MYKPVIILLTTLLITSCSNGYQTTASDSNLGNSFALEEAIMIEDEMEMEAPRTAEPQEPPQFTLEKGTKIIKNGYMNFEVTKLEQAKSKVDTLLNNIDGYYENEQYNSYGNRISYSLQLRIPNAQFDSIIYVIEYNVGEMKSKNITAKDVTEEYVDLNIRLENNLAYLTQYKEILRQAKSVKDILEVQEKIRKIEEEINSRKGRLKYLDDKVKYSTLNLELTELITNTISYRQSFGRRLVNAFNNGVQGFLSFIVGLVNLWPFVIIVLLLFLGRRPIVNRLRRRRSKAE